MVVFTRSFLFQSKWTFTSNSGYKHIFFTNFTNERIFYPLEIVGVVRETQHQVDRNNTFITYSILRVINGNHLSLNLPL